MESNEKKLEICVEEQTKMMDDWKTFLESELVKVKNEHSDMLSAHQSDVESKVKSLHENHNDFQDNYKETIQNLIQDTEKKSGRNKERL